MTEHINGKCSKGQTYSISGAVGACCKPAGSTGGACENLNEADCNAVEPVGESRVWQPNESCGSQGQRCPYPGCFAREGDCFSSGRLLCEGGPLDGQSCDFDGDCQGFCNRNNMTCIGGSNNDEPCFNDSDCSDDGACRGFCEGGAPELLDFRCLADFSCEFDFANSSCVFDGPGSGVCKYGDHDGQSCDSDRDCENTICECQAGCEQPLCCTDICEYDSFCCNECWDAQCALLAASICIQDCNSNGISDDEDIANGTSPDCNTNGIPDECEENDDTDSDGVIDECDTCPESQTNETIVINGCDTNVVNIAFDDGCTMADMIAGCQSDIPLRRIGKNVSCIADLANNWLRRRLITGREYSRIITCSTRANTLNRIILSNPQLQQP